MFLQNIILWLLELLLSSYHHQICMSSCFVWVLLKLFCFSAKSLDIHPDVQMPLLYIPKQNFVLTRGLCKKCYVQVIARAWCSSTRPNGHLNARWQIESRSNHLNHFFFICSIFILFFSLECFFPPCPDLSFLKDCLAYSFHCHKNILFLMDLQKSL